MRRPIGSALNFYMSDFFDDVDIEPLGKLQLYSKGRSIDRRSIEPGSYGIPERGNYVVDLGSRIDLLVFARRPKAIDFSDTEVLIVSYDTESPEFRRAVTAWQNDGHSLYGVSFLVFERTTSRFLEFFCGSKSARKEAKNIYPFLQITRTDIEARGMADPQPRGPLPMTLKSRMVQERGYSWFVPVIEECSNPFTNAPPAELCEKEVSRFLSVMSSS